MLDKKLKGKEEKEEEAIFEAEGKEEKKVCIQSYSGIGAEVSGEGLVGFSLLY